ncbi:MAG: hypothetical protein R3C40_07355 [Parvularculaceae bacterium]
MSANAVSNNQTRSAPRTATGMLETLLPAHHRRGGGAGDLDPAAADHLANDRRRPDRDLLSEYPLDPVGRSLNDFANLEATPQSLQTSNLRPALTRRGTYEITALSTTCSAPMPTR